ncbi:MAG TPA: hypothetical protein VHW01_01560 [Polyangiaceae bacterium]|jgi:hypothetical protein|nr:hypothetical protein [Polyangiaceae bacterium]
MHNSIALTEFQIRRASDLNIENLPPELQETAAELLCTIIDATHKSPGAIEELRKIASKLAPKTTRKDDYQRDRPLVTQLIERTKESIDAGPIFSVPGDQKDAQEAHRALEVRVLIDHLATIDSAFASLDPAVVVPLLRLRSAHKIAATLTVDFCAFGESKPETKAARAEAIERVARLSLRAASA